MKNDGQNQGKIRTWLYRMESRSVQDKHLDLGSNRSIRYKSIREKIMISILTSGENHEQICFNPGC